LDVVYHVVGFEASIEVLQALVQLNWWVTVGTLIILQRFLGRPVTIGENVSVELLSVTEMLGEWLPNEGQLSGVPPFLFVVISFSGEEEGIEAEVGEEGGIGG
jgi:hypothetical protein